VNHLDETKIRAWKHQVDLPTADYPHAHILPVKPVRRLNYSTWFAIVTLALYGLSWLLFH
jgi:hypothetical protein